MLLHVSARLAKDIWLKQFNHLNPEPPLPDFGFFLCPVTLDLKSQASITGGYHFPRAHRRRGLGTKAQTWLKGLSVVSGMQSIPISRAQMCKRLLFMLHRGGGSVNEVVSPSEVIANLQCFWHWGWNYLCFSGAHRNECPKFYRIFLIYKFSILWLH